MGIRLDAIWATAAAGEVTPGGQSNIGIEADVTLFYHTDNYQADVAYGIFLPGGAFDAVEGRARIPAIANFYDIDGTYLAGDSELGSAGTAHTLQFRMMWAF